VDRWLTSHSGTVEINWPSSHMVAMQILPMPAFLAIGAMYEGLTRDQLIDCALVANIGDQRQTSRAFAPDLLGDALDIAPSRSLLVVGIVFRPSSRSGNHDRSASSRQHSRDWPSRLRRIKDRAEILLDNVFRPLTVPATGGFFSAILVFVLVFQMILPGITVRAVQNDVALNLMRPAELVSLSDYPQSWAPEQNDLELSLPHGLLLDVTVDAQGQMTGYQILSGPSSLELRRQLDQMLLFSRFSPMLSFGRPTAGGHVILSFSAVHVRG